MPPAPDEDPVLWEIVKANPFNPEAALFRYLKHRESL
jgi:hypothetical protein